MSKGPLGFSISLRQFQTGFIDRDWVQRVMQKRGITVLSRFGGAVRLTARRSIRKAPKRAKNLRSWGPPYSRTGLLRESILYTFHSRESEVVIGPFAFNTGAQSPPAPQALEFGGRVDTRRGSRSLHYHRRPFMGPAFDATMDRLPSFFQAAARIKPSA